MQDNSVPTNQFGGTSDDQLGTYPIPPSILADDQQNQLQSAQSTEPPPMIQLDEPAQMPTHQPEPTQPQPILQPQTAPHQKPASHSQATPAHPATNIHQPKINPLTPPPVGSPEEADQYIDKLIRLIDHSLIDLNHTDLKQFDPSTLQDHYQLNFDSYEIEVSHSKSANTDDEFYLLLFNELSKVQNICVNKTILAYIRLSPAQFGRFKNAADGYLNRRKIAEERDRFDSALAPINDHLDQLLSSLPQDQGTDQSEDQYQNDQYNQQDYQTDTGQAQPPQESQDNMDPGINDSLESQGNGSDNTVYQQDTN